MLANPEPVSDLKRGVAIGIDAGGTKTLGILVDADGNELARADASGANPWDVGHDAAQRAIASVLKPLSAGGNVRAVCLGSAGVDRDADRATAEADLRALVPADISIAVRNDAAASLTLAGPKRPAMVVIAGTGSIAYGEGADGSITRVGGHGAIIGDAGSGSAFGLGAIRHTANALDGCELRGLLAESVIERLQLRRALDIVERIQRPELDVPLVASLAPLVEQAYQGGDPAARHLVELEGNALAVNAKRVARTIRTKEALPALLVGSIFAAFPEIRDRVKAGLRQTGAMTIVEKSECVMGAARLALDLAQRISDSR
jgi:N-acetylglucosamine kinase-like BadF-type ATPase